jgi:Uma2 family endonuclease
LDQSLGGDRSNPRLYYLAGVLEIMTISGEHERIKKWIGNFLAMYFEEVGAVDRPRGEATLRAALKQAGAAPDESWSLGEVKEIALSSGGIDKLELYQRFLVPEVRIWRSHRLEIYSLSAAGAGYELVPARSPLLPDLDIALLEQCVGILDWPQARKTFRAGLQK